jgi:hypothetical protein
MYPSYDLLVQLLRLPLDLVFVFSFSLSSDIMMISADYFLCYTPLFSSLSSIEVCALLRVVQSRLKRDTSIPLTFPLRSCIFDC